jgi:predicted DNA-binding transcriptional regulator YafY
MDRKWVTHRLRPITIMFTDYYFYLIAFKVDDKDNIPLYFRVDRVKYITEHRKTFTRHDTPDFDEGLLRKRSLFMWPGKLRTIRFEYTGPSVQAVLDKLPTAKVIERSGGMYLLEAEVYGDGIKMWLLSQGKWVKVIAPDEFVEEIKTELQSILTSYDQ